MTKKHFIALADDIKKANHLRDVAGLPLVFDETAKLVLANFCARQNPNFNRERWLGYIAGSNGKNGGAVK